MTIEDLLTAGNVTVSVTPADLKEFALYVLEQKEADKAQQQREKKPFLTPAEAQKALGIKRTTLWRWERSGYLTPIRLGRSPRYKREDVERLINGAKEA